MDDSISLLPTYVDGLDQALGGGIPRGSTVVVAGTPGTLKTSLVFNILYHNSRYGLKALYLTLEQSAENLKAAMKRFGLDDFNESQIYIVDISALRLELNAKEVDRKWMDILTEIIKEAVNINHYELLALDSLDALYSLMGLQNPRRELFHFFRVLKEIGLTTFLISEVPFGSRTITQYGEDFLADGILHLQHVELSECEVELRLRCMKMRMMKHEPTYHTLVHDGRRFSAIRPASNRPPPERQILLNP